MNIESLFGSQGNIPATNYPESVELTGIFNTHFHPRRPFGSGDGRTELVMPYTAAVCEDVCGIMNFPTIVRPEEAIQIQREWERCLPAFRRTKIHTAILLNENSDPAAVVRAYDDTWQGALATKTFIRAVSNSGHNDVDDIRKIIPVLKAVSDVKRFKNRKTPMVNKFHLERKYTMLGRRIPYQDRERAAVERDLEFILREVPEAVIEICHVSLASTLEAVEYYRSKGYNVSAEIPYHYALYTIDDLFEDGNGGTALCGDKFCLPIFKQSHDRDAIARAMTSGKSYYHWGEDDACWAEDPTKEKGVKTNNIGITIGGQTAIPEAVVSGIIEKFVEDRRPIEMIQSFVSDNARQLYGLQPGERKIRFVRHDWKVPQYIEHTFPDGSKIRSRVAMGGQMMKYKISL